ncbi:MAG: hypothetical protein JWQ35_2701, partial [Bacteriovoracaceae bacterium]|nr:hypothetical protein [Bacteriovoracaceae bacterium]
AKPLILNFPDDAVKKVQRILSDTFQSGPKSSFFPDDFGIRQKIGLPYYEDLSEKNATQKMSHSELEIRLANIVPTTTGISAKFDSRVSWYSQPACLSNFKEGNEIPDLNPKEELGQMKGLAWKLVSDYSLQSVENGKWHLESSAQKGQNDRVEVFAAKELIDHISRAAVLGGLYCMSTRVLWPRPGYLPLIEFHPTKFPEFKLDQNGTRAKVVGDLVSFDLESKNPKQKGVARNLEINEKFVETDRRPVDFELGFSLDKNSKEIRWSVPSDINISQSKDENELLQEILKNSIMPKLKEVTWLAQVSTDLLKHIFSKFFSMKGPPLKDLQVSAEGIKLDVDVGSFDWLLPEEASKADEKKESDSKPLENKNEVIPVPKTVKIEAPLEIYDPNVEVSWQPNDQLFFSSRKRNIDSGEWGEWSSFQGGNRTKINFEKSGRYIVQVRAMNRGFEIEPIPVQYEFYYQQPELTDLMSAPAVSRKEKTDGAPGKLTSPQPRDLKPAALTAAPEASMGSKGLFGCGIQMSKSESSSSLLFLFFCSVLSLFVMRKKVQ